MSIFEYDEKEVLDYIREEERTIGRAEGRTEGRTEEAQKYGRLIRNFLSLGITLLFHIHKGIIGFRQALDFLAFRYFL